MRLALSLADLSYSSTGKASTASPVTIADHGSVTVTAVTFAPRRLASSKPAATALPANSDPSVAIRMCLYMVVFPACCEVYGESGGGLVPQIKDPEPTRPE